jgi:hypothetical protein
VLIAAFAAPTLRWLELEETEGGFCRRALELNLRALARTLPQAEHLDGIEIIYDEYIHGDRILGEELLGLLRDGFAQNTSISEFKVENAETEEGTPIRLSSFYAARLSHQLGKVVVDPPVALLPHMMRQTALKLEYEHGSRMSRRECILNSTFVTLQYHMAQLTTRWADRAREGEKNKA